MNSNVKQIIEDNLDLINENRFEELYENVPENYRGELSDILLDSGIDFLSYMNYVPAYAFFISTIKKINIPQNIKSIEAYAFYGCTGLTSITIPDSVINIDNSAFRGCTGLTSVTIGNSVTKIGYEAFRYCTGLTSIIIPNSVKNIRSGAFYGCTGLTSVTIPSSVKDIDWQAFSDCNNLRDINFKGTKKKFLSIPIGSDAIRDGVTIHCTDGDFIYEVL